MESSWRVNKVNKPPDKNTSVRDKQKAVKTKTKQKNRYFHAVVPLDETKQIQLFSASFFLVLTFIARSGKREIIIIIKSTRLNQLVRR